MSEARPGTLLSIHIAPAPGVPMEAVREAELQAGKGIVGDRYFLGTGTFYKGDPRGQLTLIEAEAVATFAEEAGLEMAPGEARRNLVVSGLDLNSHVGRELQVGTVRLRGLELCEPCKHLQKVTGKPVLPGLVGRGGLRAEILEGGVVRVGDEVVGGEVR